jgi:hypothetical protein
MSGPGGHCWGAPADNDEGTGGIRVSAMATLVKQPGSEPDRKWTVPLPEGEDEDESEEADDA